MSTGLQSKCKIQADAVGVNYVHDAVLLTFCLLHCLHATAVVMLIGRVKCSTTMLNDQDGGGLSLDNMNHLGMFQQDAYSSLGIEKEYQGDNWLTQLHLQNVS